jgi:hypothetical protein
MANTFELIASSTVGSGGVSSIDFTSIPSTYTDLCLKVSLRTNRVDINDGVRVKINNSTTTYTQRALYGNGTSASSYTDTLPLENGAGANASTSTASTFSNTEWYFPNYAGSNYKSVSSDGVVENNATGGIQNMVANLWSTVTAISSLIIIPGYGTTILQYSTAYLYGVKNA